MNERRNDQFWGESLGSSYRVLFRRDRLVEFFPSQNMSFEERLNAITRLCIYLGIVLYLYTTKAWVVYIPLIAHAFTMLVYRSRQPDNVDVDAVKVISNIDSTIYNEHYDPGSKTKQLKREGCTVPTKDNPFMNVTMDQYTGDPTRPSACSGKEIEENTEDQFNYGLYKDTNDIFNRNNGQNRFVTMPSTQIPNDQGGLGQWLYGLPKTCKEDSNACLRNEDVRQGSRGMQEYINNPLNTLATY